ncbi:3-ketoacyl-ACP reductase [Brucella vulpis]|nr:short chain dehydrogenase/reductase family oxidoreductase [Brucella vulpis]CUW50323.1 3-ketoacyl-ACP reductase [Brucella vulpis]
MGFQGDPLTLSHRTIENRAWKHDNSESRNHNSRGQWHGSSLGSPSGTGWFCSCHSVILRQGRSPRQRIGGIGVTGSNQSNDDLQKLVDQTLEKWGRIDVLVNSAGHGPRAPILEITDEDWHKGMDTYFLNAVRPARLVVPAMQKQKSGVIINISTAWAFEPSAMFPTSAVFRAGLASFTKIFADTYAAENIRMNNVLPGWIDSLPATEERRESVPMQRYGKSEEIAATVSFLASDGAAYITGQNLRMDGGLTRSV